MIVHYCNLCHKEIPDDQVLCFRRRVRYSEIIFDTLPKTKYYDNIELCPACTQSFETWMEYRKCPRGDME